MQRTKESISVMRNNFVNYFHCTADNVGDRMCGPAQYVWPTECVNLPFGTLLPGSADRVIIGGGQVFAQAAEIVDTIHLRSPRAKVAAWGIGLPRPGVRDADVIRMADGLVALGTRNYEWRDKLTFVPCASCLSTVFDVDRLPEHEFVVYFHRKKPGPRNIPPGTPVLNNSMRSPDSVINFIASGDTVVTSSYHGVYWAQLLGRRVVCIPYGSKFESLQHRPTMAEPGDWLGALKVASRAMPLLEEYRALNMSFAANVTVLLNE